jgi:Protein of unknown function (DUF2924)
LKRLAFDVGLAGLSLGVERVEFLIQPMLGGFPAVDSAADNLRVKRYRELFRSEPPKAFGPDLLRRSIAHTIQEKAYGGLPPPTKRLLDQMVKAASTKPNGRLELPPRIKPGSELVRTWNGKTYRVVVMAFGFAHGGKTFASPSEIAAAITGTKWNGPRFFGLRSATRREATDFRSTTIGILGSRSSSASTVGSAPVTPCITMRHLTCRSGRRACRSPFPM